MEKIKQATPADLPVVAFITRRTIQKVYPRYYPMGIVRFFLDWHRDENILADIQAGEVYLLYSGPVAVGTVTLHATAENAEAQTIGDEITRLYVLPEYQGKGYGSMLLDFAEETIGRAHGKIHLEASLPAAALYWRRGYRVVDVLSEPQPGGDVLCWDVMEKAYP